MRILKILVSIILILGGIFVAGGLLLPSEWSVSRQITIQAKGEQIYPYVSNFKQWEKWSPWNSTKDPSLKYTYSGAKSGAGAKQTWTSEKMGSGWMLLTAADPQTGVAYELFIDMNGHQSTLHGNIQFTSKDHETTVTWTDHGDAGKSFTNRWMTLLLKPMLGKDIDTGLAGLKSIVEKKSA